MKTENLKFEVINSETFLEYWDSTKTNHTRKTSEIVSFFKPFIETIPKLALGEYYWQIFNNAQPVPKILMVGGDVEKMTPTDAEGLLSCDFASFFAFFHPDDINQVLTYVAKIFEMMFSMSPEQRINYNYTVYARIQ